MGAEPEDKDLRCMYELMEESRTLHAWRDVRRPTLRGCGCGRKSKSTLLRQNLDVTVFAAAKNGTGFRNPLSWVLLERKGV